MHTQECLKLQKQRQIWLIQYPDYCQMCQGQGTESYDPSPLGVSLSGGVMTDLCPDCTGQGICPRCAKPGLAHGEENTGEGPCTFCGWMYEDGRLPINECICNEEKGLVYLLKGTGQHVVVLSQRVIGPMQELRADMAEASVILTRWKGEKKPKTYTLSAAEADDFVTAWIAFRSAQYEIELEVVRREVETRQQAYALAAQSEITIGIVSSHEWDIRLSPSLPYRKYNRHAYSVEELLQCVQEAEKCYVEDQRIQQEVKKALSIVSQIEGLSVEQVAHDPSYYSIQFGKQRANWVPDDTLLNKMTEVSNDHFRDLRLQYPAIPVEKLESGEWIIGEGESVRGLIAIFERFQKCVALLKEESDS